MVHFRKILSTVARAKGSIELCLSSEPKGLLQLRPAEKQRLQESRCKRSPRAELLRTLLMAHLRRDHVVGLARSSVKRGRSSSCVRRLLLLRLPHLLLVVPLGRRGLGPRGLGLRELRRRGLGRRGLLRRGLLRRRGLGERFLHRVLLGRLRGLAR